MVKIRLSRYGNTHNPHYRLVVVDARQKRDGGYLENLGHYDPRKKVENYLVVDVDRAKYWLGVGAQASDTARRLLKQAGVYRKEA
jgi:small subunit ribosomal protein S16